MSSGKRWIMHPAVYGVADQMILSAANFSVGLFFARYATPEAFGLYALAFIVVNTIGDLHRSVAWQPMIILSGLEQERLARTRYWRTRRLSVMFGTALGIASGLFAFGVFFLAGGESRLFWTALALGPTLTFGVSHEIQKRIGFLIGKHRKVLESDFLYLLGVLSVLGVAFLALKNTNFLPQSAVGVAALATGALFGFLGGRTAATSLRSSGPSPGPGGLLRKHWPIAKWNLLNVALAISSDRFLIFFLSGTAGLTAVANLEAGRLLAMPLFALFMGLLAHALPTMAKTMRTSGFESTLRSIEYLGSFLLVTTFLYGVLLALFADMVGTNLFTHNYTHLALIACSWSLVIASRGLAGLGTAALGLIGQSRWATWARLAGVFTLAVLVISFNARFDEQSVAVILALSSTVTWSIMWLRLRFSRAAAATDKSPRCASWASDIPSPTALPLVPPSLGQV